MSETETETETETSVGQVLDEANPSESLRLCVGGPRGRASYRALAACRSERIEAGGGAAVLDGSGARAKERQDAETLSRGRGEVGS